MNGDSNIKSINKLRWRWTWLLIAIIWLVFLIALLLALTIYTFPFGMILFPICGLLSWAVASIIKKMRPLRLKIKDELAQRTQSFRAAHAEAEASKSKTVYCENCGEEVSSDTYICPHCNEPVSREKTRVKLLKSLFRKWLIWFTISMVIVIALSIMWGDFLLVVMMLVTGFGVLAYNAGKIGCEVSDERDEPIVCPRCGSHHVALGRKGYDWNQASWYNFFGIKGTRYLAGLESRRVIAYCDHCGFEWKTNRKWIR